MYTYVLAASVIGGPLLYLFLGYVRDDLPLWQSMKSNLQDPVFWLTNVVTWSIFSAMVQFALLLHPERDQIPASLRDPAPVACTTRDDGQCVRLDCGPKLRATWCR